MILFFKTFIFFFKEITSTSVIYTWNEKLAKLVTHFFFAELVTHF